MKTNHMEEAQPLKGAGRFLEINLLENNLNKVHKIQNITQFRPI